jgi:hypothetical protein
MGKFALIRTLMLGAICVVPGLADPTLSTAQLLFHANLTSSVTLVFQNNPAAGSTGYCSLTNSGSNSVSVNLGNASQVNPDNRACVRYLSGSGSYSVSSAFDVVVTIMNSGSRSYSLAAQLSAAPPSGVTWSLNGAGLSTSLHTFQPANAYASPATETIGVNVQRSVAAQTLTLSVNFLATAN